MKKELLNELKGVDNKATKAYIEALPKLVDKSKIIKTVNDPHKRLMGNTQNLASVLETSESNRSSKSSWKIDKNILDDSEFRKSQIKTEKIEIDCTPNRSMIRFSDNEDENESEEKTANIGIKFNNLVRDQIVKQFYQVNDFLKSVHLEKYLDKFIQNGLSTLDKIIESKFYLK